ncbi:MAG: hypothetical protein Q8S00_28850, partial [Deltaproteobacteria bacterium]|nr:hypothetical protein [Deltaproteobacteria bacterium]
MSQTFWARTDSNSANNPALNLTGDPATQITFVPSGSNGDIFLEYNGGAPDPDTQGNRVWDLARSKWVLRRAARWILERGQTSRSPFSTWTSSSLPSMTSP